MNKREVYIDKETRTRILRLYERGESAEDIATKLEKTVPVIKKILQREGVYDRPLTKEFMKNNGHRWDDARLRVRRAAGWS